MSLDIPNDDFDTLGVEGTAKMLGGLMENLASNLVRIGRAVSWLREQGCDVSMFEERLPRGDLRAIADGLILPEVWLKLNTRRKLLKATSALPRDQQLKLAGGTPIEVVERKPDGSTDVSRVAIENLPTELIPQVFDGPRIRTVAEQRAATMRPVAEPVIDRPDREAMLAETRQLPDAYAAGTPREKRRVADRAMEIWGKLSLMAK